MIYVGTIKVSEKRLLTRRFVFNQRFLLLYLRKRKKSGIVVKKKIVKDMA